MEQLYRWRSMLTDQPKNGTKVLMQYKSFDFEDKKYTVSNKEWFIKNVQCWLEPIEESEQDELWDDVENIFDKHTAPTGGGYEANYTDKHDFIRECKSKYLLIKR